ncbi:MAG: IS66 family transposase [Alphaproteobacteria bacterium]|nr:IS66 family transposase [Alphaproteobacteria bacterium]
MRPSNSSWRSRRWRPIKPSGSQPPRRSSLQRSRARSRHRGRRGARCRSTCPSCGGSLRRIGEEITETLDYVPGRFKVVRHIREKLSCRACDTVVAAPAPDHAIARGRAGAGLLAHIVVSKYDDHLPRYRQAEIFAREGVTLETSGWVGATAAALDPLIDALAADVMTSDTLHVDDTPVPVLAPGTGKTKTGRLWTYVRDERPVAGVRPPAALFFYSPDRKGEHPPDDPPRVNVRHLMYQRKHHARLTLPPDVAPSKPRTRRKLFAGFETATPRAPGLLAHCPSASRRIAAICPALAYKMTPARPMRVPLGRPGRSRRIFLIVTMHPSRFYAVETSGSAAFTASRSQYLSGQHSPLTMPAQCAVRRLTCRKNPRNLEAHWLQRDTARSLLRYRRTFLCTCLLAPSTSSGTPSLGPVECSDNRRAFCGSLDSHCRSRRQRLNPCCRWAKQTARGIKVRVGRFYDKTLPKKP